MFGCKAPSELLRDIRHGGRKSLYIYVFIVVIALKVVQAYGHHYSSSIPTCSMF